MSDQQYGLQACRTCLGAGSVCTSPHVKMMTTCWVCKGTGLASIESPLITACDPPSVNDNLEARPGEVLLARCAAGDHHFVRAQTVLHYTNRRHIECVVCDLVLSLPTDGDLVIREEDWPVCPD